MYRNAPGIEDGTGWSIVNHKTERQSLKPGWGYTINETVVSTDNKMTPTLTN